MSLNTKSKMAISALLDLCLYQQAGPVSLSLIAKRQQVSLSSLEQVFTHLRQAGIVRSVRGPGGGYTLNCRPADLPLRNVAELFEPIGAISDETHLPSTHGLWLSLKEHLLELLNDITLQSLIDKCPKPDTASIKPFTVRLTRGIANRTKQSAIKPHAPNFVFNLGNFI